MKTREKEREIQKKEKKQKKKSLIIDIFFIILSVLSSAYLIYNLLLLTPIEKVLRYVIIGLICLFNLVMIINLFRKNTKKKKIKKGIKRFLLLILIIIFIVIGYNINLITDKLGSMNKKYITSSTSLVTLKSNEIDDVKNIKNSKIAIGNNEDDNISYILPMEIIDKYNLDDNNEIVEYEDGDYQSMIRDLYKGVVNYIFLPTNYVEIYSEMEEYETLESDTKIIISTSKQETKEETELLGSSQDISKPFTMLLLGVDSKNEGIANSDSFNGDAMILITFNPDTLTATMLSIPRDSYVPIACMTNKTENKITHAASRGTKCTINTIQNYFGITIDYYAKINFAGLVDLVNALDGIEVDVPYALCEQNSKRKWGSQTVQVEAGKQILNGEQALALSRNRHKPNDGSKVGKKMAQYCPTKNKGTRNDFVRGQNQQLVLRGIMNKAKKIDSPSTVYEILDAISNNMDTNMSRDTILSFYNIAKDIIISSKNEDSDLFTIQKLYLAGADQKIYDERSHLVLYNFIPNQESKASIIDAMKENLGLKKAKDITTFSYSVEDPYEQNVIGKHPKTATKLYTLIPNFASYTRAQATSWGVKNGFQVIFKETTSTKYANGTIINQSYPEKKRVDLCTTKTITLTIVNNQNTTTTKPKDEDTTTDDEKNTETTPGDSSSSQSGGSSDNTSSGSSSSSSQDGSKDSDETP